jgi:hypothetical protein
VYELPWPAIPWVRLHVRAAGRQALRRPHPQRHGQAVLEEPPVKKKTHSSVPVPVCAYVRQVINGLLILDLRYSIDLVLLVLLLNFDLEASTVSLTVQRRL